MLLGLARRVLGDAEDAADVVQESYLRAWRALPRFRADACESTWLYAIVVNAARDRLRQRRREGDARFVQSYQEPADICPWANPHVLVDDGVLSPKLHAALEGLPGQRCQMMILRALVGLPHQAIASRLGITTSAAKVGMHRARRQLQQLLGDPRRVGDDDPGGPQGPER
jgi:RNA polymerase sigma-70 factor (ECF subfamily)